MFKTLTKTQFLELADKNRYVAIYRELLADTFTPISALECLAKNNESAILLESGFKFREHGSYSFLGIHPYATFSTKNSTTIISTDKINETHQSSPLELLREFHKNYHCVCDEYSKLAGQMMGFLAYDAVRYFEKLPNQHTDNADCPDILFHFHKINLIFDHESNKLMIVVIAEADANNNPAVYDNAQHEIDTIIAELQHSSPTVSSLSYTEDTVENIFSTDCDDEQFAQKVVQAKKYIQAGDAFQIVLSRTFNKPLKTSPLSIYRMLRYSNPTPYMFYLTTPNFIAFGASPEKLVSVHDRQVTIVPIAGTLPITDESSELLLQRLREDDKQKAEHMMLIDLARNDIGAVCEPGSVEVSEIMQGQRLSHVMHMVSYVKGRLASQYDAFDLLKFAFPAGTLTGAPKIRAMEIIDELETSRRNLYGGAICKIDTAGNLDSCIIIRSGIVKDGNIQVRAGAGIVFDSVPVDEVAETRHKAKGVFQAVSEVERGSL